MIPRVIHQIWWQGSRNVPEDYAQNAARLREINPGWDYKLWDGPQLEQECARFSLDVLATFLSYKHMHQKIDLGRQVVLFLHGGVSLDMDIKARQPLNMTPGLDQAPMIISRSAVSSAYLTLFSGGRLKSACNNSVIMCEPRLPLTKSVIKAMVEAAGYQSMLTYLTIQWTTGPFLFSTAINGAAETDEVLILPPELFESGKNHPDAIVTHEHCNSWLPWWFVAVNMGLSRLWQRSEAVAP